MLYQSCSNPKMKEIKKLHVSKYRKEKKLFLIEGEHLVLEAYRTGYLQELLLLEGTEFSLPVETNYVTQTVLNDISMLETPQPILGICKQPELSKITGNHILALDQIQDPGNMGTIIRSAVAFEVDMILVSKDSVDIYNEKVVRATQGLLFSIPIMVCDLQEELKRLKEKEYTIYVTDVTGGESSYQIKPAEKYILVMGNEGKGVREEIKSYATLSLYIPMNQRCESLNVGVATSILLYALKDSEKNG